MLRIEQEGIIKEIKEAELKLEEAKEKEAEFDTYIASLWLGPA